MGSKRPLSATIEKVRRHDLSDLEKIFAAAFGEEVNADRLRQRIHRVKQFYYLLLPLSAMSLWVKNLFNIYICRVEGVIAGFIQISSLNAKQLHLDFIAVSNRFRGQGLGTWMLHQLLKKAADDNNLDIVLEVKLGNPAHHLYKRMGFSDQAQVIHYEKKFELVADTNEYARELEGFRERRDTDWRQVYLLYLKSIPVKLQRTMVRPITEFNPSLFTRSLEWTKNRLMGNIRREFVIERESEIVGSLELYSYPKTENHIMNVMLHPNFEVLRTDVVSKALSLLSPYRKGLVSTTIYNDAINKQQVLVKQGFNRTDTYCLMFRPPHPARGKIAVYPVSQAYQEHLDHKLPLKKPLRSHLKSKDHG